LNTFQKYWSYINRIVVEEKSTPHNSKLIVAIQNGKYVLNTKSANYSFGSLHRVFQKTFKKIHFIQKKYTTCLLLGGGVGSVPSIFYHELNLALKTDFVEIDSEVIGLGKRYFCLSKYPLLTIINDDAKCFLEKNTALYDVIIVDLFIDLDVPTYFTSEAFFISIKEKLCEKGSLIFNFVAYNYELKEKAKAIESKLKIIFEAPKFSTKTLSFEGINKVIVVEKIKLN
jgi:spermidine synthase